MDGAAAHLVVVPVRHEGRLELFVVGTDGPGVDRQPLVPLDSSRRFARVRLEGARARRLASAIPAEELLPVVLDLARVLLAAEQVGVAETCLAMATGYAKQRVQFGRPIGSFQAIKHKCADALVRVECASAAAQYASWVATADRSQLGPAAVVANSYCSEAAFFAAAQNIQVHGGIGFTWEHPAHLYFKRAKVSQLLFGPVAAQRERLALTVLG
jgi:alkylation response protein AidB-like acyl-CoA dehydrogenase